MPFEAAKAVAATFCYRIRNALVPLFGPEFVSQCLHPTADGYGSMIISPKIVQQCTETAHRHRQEALRETSLSRTSSQGDSSRPTSGQEWNVNSIVRVDLQIGQNKKTALGKRDDRAYLPSPQPSHVSKRLGSPIHLPTKAPNGLTESFIVRHRSPSPNTGESSETSKSSSGDNSGSTPVLIAHKSLPPPRLRKLPPPKGRDGAEPSVMSNEDFKAAWTLVQLNLADAARKVPVKGPRKRRASS